MVQQFMALLGFPFADEKQQAPGFENDFLGLVHDLRTLRRDGVIHLWARDRLLTKISSLISQAESHDRLSSGLASKLYGCLGFLDQGTFGRVARSGLNHLKERQYVATSELTPELRDTFQLVRALLEVRPRRQVQLDSFRYMHITVASDASQDMPQQGKAGVLLVHPSCGRLGTVIRIDASIFALWSSHPTKIAQLELLAVVQGLLSYPSLFRHARVVWYVDNIAALMALVRGRSDNPELDHMSQIAHLLLYQLQSYAYWEGVPSSSNWADGISRDGASDPWLLRHGFRIHFSSVYTALWRFPFRVLSRVFAYLS
eukprot:Skav201171  [mRNA]  locus=scaffold65:680096:681040:- [translate_table: standard]